MIYAYENERSFVRFLNRLKEQESRGEIAILRKGLRGDPEKMPELYPIVIPQLPDGTYGWKEKVYFEIATLFAMHPVDSSSGDMGKTFRTIQKIMGSESTEKRFAALLRTHKDEVFGQLRQAVSLARSKDLPINWVQLLIDMQHWNDEEKRVQQRWARSYWSPPMKDEEPEEGD